MTARRTEVTAAQWEAWSTSHASGGRRTVVLYSSVTGPQGPPGGSATVKEAGTVVSSTVTTFDFGAGFDLTESPAGEVNIGLDLTELPAASETAQGPVELATTLEAVAGVDTGRAVTPAGVAAVVAAAVANLINSAPGALDTLDELAAALGDDANFAATVTAALAGKAATSHTHAASDVVSGTIATARMGSGSASALTFLRGDQTWASHEEALIIAVGDETTALTAGTAKVTFRMPFAMTLSAVRASLTTASSSGTPTVDINEGGSTILSTKLTIDANERTSTTAATAAVISDSALAADAEMTIDIDTAGTAAAGLKVALIGTRA